MTTDFCPIFLGGKLPERLKIYYKGLKVALKIGLNSAVSETKRNIRTLYLSIKDKKF